MRERRWVSRQFPPLFLSRSKVEGPVFHPIPIQHGGSSYHAGMAPTPYPPIKHHRIKATEQTALRHVKALMLHLVFEGVINTI